MTGFMGGTVVLMLFLGVVLYAIVWQISKCRRELPHPQTGVSGPTFDGKDFLILIGAILWVVCPFDGDFLPVLGWIDDAGVIGFAITHFYNKFWSKKELPSNDDVIDAEFEVRPTQREVARRRG